MLDELNAYADGVVTTLCEVELSPAQIGGELAGLVSESKRALRAMSISVYDDSETCILRLGHPGDGDPDEKSRRPLEVGTVKDYVVEVWRGHGQDEIPGHELLAIACRCFEAFVAKEDRNPVSGLLDFKRSEAVQVRARRAYRRTLDSGNHCAALFLDLDGFKEVNDQIGHNQGDRVIARLGQLVMRQAADEPNCIPYHYGGDEFVLLLTPGSPEGALSLGLNFLEAAGEWDFESDGLPVDLSIGIAHSLVGAPDSFEQLRVAAERAMVDEVKKRTSGTVRFVEPVLETQASYCDELCIALAKSTVSSPQAGAFASPWLNVLASSVEKVWRSDDLNSAAARAQQEVDRIIRLGKVAARDGSVRVGALPKSLGQHDTVVLTRADLAVGVAYGCLRGLSRASYATQDRVEIRRDGSSHSVYVGGTCVWGDDDATSVFMDFGEAWQLESPEEPTLAAMAILVQIGHEDVAVPTEVTAARIVVDDRPTGGGGLPDFWEVTLARLIAELLRRPNVDEVLIVGEENSGRQTISRLQQAGEWDAELIAYKTNLQRTQIEKAQTRIQGKSSIFATGEEALRHLAESCRQAKRLVPDPEDPVGQADPLLERRLVDTGKIGLTIDDGCRVSTAARAFPYVLEIIRQDPGQPPLILDQAGVQIRELVDFRVELTEPGESKIPAFYDSDAAQLEAYYQREFCSEDGLFYNALRVDDQYSAVVHHIADAIDDTKKPYATRRGVLVVAHNPIPDAPLKPLGLVSIRCLPRSTDDGTRLSFSFTWRTVEVLVGFPYSLFGSVRFAEDFTGEVLRNLERRDVSSTEVQLGSVSYIAHSLHMFMDDYARSIARRIVNDASA